MPLLAAGFDSVLVGLESLEELLEEDEEESPEEVVDEVEVVDEAPERLSVL